WSSRQETEGASPQNGVDPGDPGTESDPDSLQLVEVGRARMEVLAEGSPGVDPVLDPNRARPDALDYPVTVGISLRRRDAPRARAVHRHLDPLHGATLRSRHPTRDRGGGVGGQVLRPSAAGDGAHQEFRGLEGADVDLDAPPPGGQLLAVATR